MQNVVYIFNTEGSLFCGYVATKRPKRYRRTEANYIWYIKLLCAGGIVVRLV